MDIKITAFLQNIGFGHLKYEGSRSDLLKILLKALLSDKTIISVKLDLVIFIEEESEYLLSDIDAVKLTATAFRAILKGPMNEINAVVQGQSLISLTSMLLSTFQNDNNINDSSYLVNHMELLLTIVSQTNNSKNIYLRSIAAGCLMETELCLPGVLNECLDVIYTATVFETSIAHQQYLELLSVLMCHSKENFSFSPDIPNFRVPESILEGGKFSPIRPSSELPSSEMEQMVAFSLGQLPLLSTTASVHVASRMATLLQALNESPQTQSLASVHMLQPVIQQYLSTHCLTACQLILNLERQFGSSEHFKDDAYRQKILDHLLLCSNNPALPVASRLIFLGWLEDFLSRHVDRVGKISEQQIAPHQSDGTHTRLKKIMLLTLIYKYKGNCSHSLLRYLMLLHGQIKSKTASVKIKSAFVKALFFICKDFNDNESAQKKETVQRFNSKTDHSWEVIQMNTHSRAGFWARYDVIKHVKVVTINLGLLVEALSHDIYFAPFLINFLQHTVDTQMEIGILRVLMPELLKPSKSTHVSHTSFECALEIMKQAVATRDSNISRPKEMLASVTEKLEKLEADISAAMGHQILSLCHKIMKLFDAREFLEEMETVLKTLATKSSEEDVQNRAHSYITLLSCLSDSKVKEVLKAQKKSISQLMVTEGMFHKPEALTIIEKQLLTLQKRAKFYIKVTAAEIETIPDFSEDSQNLYNQHINNEASVQPIVIPCAVSFTSLIKDDILPIEAVVIFLTPCHPFGKFEPLLMGNMSKKLICTGNTEVISNLKYKAAKPYPVFINARAEFSLNGSLHTSPMESFKIDFIDLFQPLPTPEQFLMFQHEWQKHIFPKLWDTMQNKDNSNCCVATTVIQRHVSHVRSKIKHELKPFVIQKGAHDASIGIFLAPSNHILIKVSFSENSAIFKISTDNIMLLAHINDYLSQW